MTDAEQVELPASAVASLMDILEAMASGRNVTIVPEDIELTTVQAAKILNVSRPFLIKLLDEGAIPHRRVGKHRRLRVEDVIAYKAAVDGDRERVLESLVHLAQTERMGYDGWARPHRSAGCQCAVSRAIFTGNGSRLFCGTNRTATANRLSELANPWTGNSRLPGHGVRVLDPCGHTA